MSVFRCKRFFAIKNCVNKPGRGPPEESRFFDGDGWCTNTTSHGKRKGSRKCIGVVSNYEFLDNLNIILNSEIGTRINKVVERIGCSMLLYSSKKDVESLREYMYNDATIYLKRKYDSCYKIYVNTERD